MAKRKSYYKVGLGSKTLNRARIIFGIAVLLTVLIIGSAVYAETQTGQVRKLVTQPLKNLAQAVGEALKDAETTPQRNIPTWNFVATSSSQINIETNTSENGAPKTNSSNVRYQYKYISPTPFPTYAGKSWEETKKEQDEWWARVHEENRQKSLDSQKSLEQFRLDSQKKMEEFKLESQLKMEEFKKQYNIP